MLLDLIRAFVEAVVVREIGGRLPKGARATGLRMLGGDLELDYEVP